MYVYHHITTSLPNHFLLYSKQHTNYTITSPYQSVFFLCAVMISFAVVLCSGGDTQEEKNWQSMNQPPLEGRPDIYPTVPSPRQEVSNNSHIHTYIHTYSHTSIHPINLLTTNLSIVSPHLFFLLLLSSLVYPHTDLIYSKCCIGSWMARPTGRCENN